jgi:CzcA family heavy metal efflux pump
MLTWAPKWDWTLRWFSGRVQFQFWRGDGDSEGPSPPESHNARFPPVIRWAVGSSMKVRRGVIGLAAAVMLLGIVQLRHAKADVLPEFGPPTVEIQTEALGLSATEVEQLITVPVEHTMLDGVAWLAAIHSTSLPGLSSVEMIFEPGTDLLRARQVVQERMSGAGDLTNVSGPPQMLQPQSSTSRVMMIGLSSHQLPLIEMSVLARWTIRPRLLGVRGVANVSIWGQREKQLQVQVQPEQLLRRGVTLDQVIETTGNSLWASPLTFLEANTPGTGGFIDTANQRLAIQHLQPIATAQDLARVPIADVSGPGLHLGDVAQVVEDHQPLIGDALLKGGPGLLLVISKSPGANTVEVTKGVEAALDAMRPGLTGMQIDTTVYRPATFIERSFRNVTTRLLIGIALLILALGALFFQWRTALISLTAVVLSLLAAGLVIYLRGATFDAMVVAALIMALVVIIDDASVEVTNVARLQGQDHGDGHSASSVRAILSASYEMRSAIGYATLVILAAGLPLLFIQGASGALLRPIVLTYAMAIVVSTVVALTVTPAFSAILLSKARRERREAPVARWLKSGYRRALSRTIGHPRMAYVAAGAAILAGVAVTPFLERSPVPSFKDANVLIRWDAAPGTSLPEMARITSRAASELRSVPGVQTVGAHLGRALTADEVVGVESSELWVGIDPKADYDRVVASIKPIVMGYPGVDAHMTTYPSERIDKVLPPKDAPIVVHLFGHDLRVLGDKAEEVRRALAGIDGVVDPRVQLQLEEPTVDVEVNLAAAQRYGIKPGDVRRAAATIVSGITVGSLFEQQKVFDVVVWSAPESRNSLTSVRNLLLDTPNGGHVQLDKVADVRIARTPTVIRHSEISRTIDVTAGVDGRDVGSVIADVKQRLKGITFPLEHHAQVAGDYADRQADRRRLLAVGVAAAIGILLLLQSAFGSWRLATVFLLALPMALAGGVLTAFAGGRVVSLGSVAGFLAVLGIACRGGIILIRHYQHLERDDTATSGRDLVLLGSRDRLVPIVMTTVGTALALLPIAVSGDIAGQEIVHPMAVVILGGLVTAALLNLFVVPALYLRFRAASSPEEAASQISTPVQAGTTRAG